ncbi:retrovirus-related pol polyprotein from transposon TNT 1-94 [Tanacetum coccineum]
MSTQQDIYAAGSENRPPMLNKENYVPWSSRLLRYAKSRPNGKLIYNSIMNGPYVRRMIPEPGDTDREVPVPATFHEQTDDELTVAEIKQMEADDQAIQTILLGLPEDIYAAVDSCETAQEIWLRVQQMMKGSDIGIQEKKAKLFNEWERFTSTDGESIESYYHRFSKLMNDFKRNKHFPEKIASNLKFLNNLQPEWSRHVTIVHQTKDLHTTDYTQLYDFLKYNQKEVDDQRAERLAKTHDPLALMANSNNPFNYPVFHQDQPSPSTYMQQPQPINNNYNPQPSFNQNYMQQPMPNPEDITDPTTAMNMALALMAKAFKLNYSTPTNNNQRISSNPRNRQIAQPGMNMGQDRQMRMVGANGGNQFRQYAGQNVGYQNGIMQYRMIGNHVVQDCSSESGVSENIGNPNGQMGVRILGRKCCSSTAESDQGEGMLLNYPTQLLIAQKEEAESNSKRRVELMAACSRSRDEIEEVTANSILMLFCSKHRHRSCNKNKEVEVEEHHRNLLLSKNKKHMSSECKHVKLDTRNDQSEVICAMCKQCLITANHDVCMLNYVNDMNSRGKKQKANVSNTENQKKQKPKVKKPKKVGSNERLASPKPSKPRFCLRWSPTGRFFDIKGKIIASSESESQPDCSNGDNACCSKHMTGNLKLLINFVWKFLGTVRFGNDHVAAILGFGDLQWGNILITRVYFVEGLGHNLFSVGQFCDSDLEVAFRRNSCFVRNLDGVDLLKGNRSTNLYTINLHEMASASPICLMARATSTKSWLWHQRLSHLNFDTINDLAKNDLVTGLPKFKYHKEHLCPSCEQGKSKRASHPPKPVPNSKQRLHLLHMDLCGPMRIASINGKRYVLVIVDDYSRYTWVHFLRSKDEAPEVIKTFLKRITVLLQSPVIIIRTDNGTEFKNQILKEYFDSVGISHQASSVRTPQQNGVVERRNRTLVEAARTMLIFSRAPLFLWAEAIATACYTQNRSIIHRRFNKTPYELINGRKPDISFLHVFGALCYPKNDREDIGKLGAKGDIGFFIRLFC